MENRLWWKALEGEHVRAEGVEGEQIRAEGVRWITD